MIQITPEMHNIDIASACFATAFICAIAWLWGKRKKKIVAKRWWNGERYTTTVRLSDHVRGWLDEWERVG